MVVLVAVTTSAIVVSVDGFLDPVSTTQSHRLLMKERFLSGDNRLGGRGGGGPVNVEPSSSSSQQSSSSFADNVSGSGGRRVLIDKGDIGRIHHVLPSSLQDSRENQFFDFINPIDEWSRDAGNIPSPTTASTAPTTTSSVKKSRSSKKGAVGGSSATSTSSPNTSYSDGDTLTRFKDDVRTILQKLRQEEEAYKVEHHQPLYRDRVPSFHSIWGQEEWKAHTSRWRYVRYLLQFPTSRLLRRVWPQMAVLLVWTASAIGMSSKHVLFARFDIGLTSMGLVSTFVAALLTLRSNQGLSRLTDARNAFAKVIQYTREMNQLIGVSVYPYDKQMGLLAARHVSCFCWTLMSYVRGTSSQNVVSSMLPNTVDASFVNEYQRKPPAAVIVRLRQVLEYLIVRDTIGKEVEKQLFQTLSKLNEALTVAERIKNSPMPPIYTAHLTRLLLFYLFWLPMSIHSALGNTLATFVVTLALGYAMLGLDEISHICELPFELMPLRQLSKMSMVDSADAVTYQPPPLSTINGFGFVNGDDHDEDGTTPDIGGQIGTIGNLEPSGRKYIYYSIRSPKNNNKDRRVWI
jgi:predicted membrane chloride channel (bestrophin family)